MQTTKRERERVELVKRVKELNNCDLFIYETRREENKRRNEKEKN